MFIGQPPVDSAGGRVGDQALRGDGVGGGRGAVILVDAESLVDVQGAGEFVNTVSCVEHAGHIKLGLAEDGQFPELGGGVLGGRRSPGPSLR